MRASKQQPVGGRYAQQALEVSNNLDAPNHSSLKRRGKPQQNSSPLDVENHEQKKQFIRTPKFEGRNRSVSARTSSREKREDLEERQAYAAMKILDSSNSDAAIKVRHLQMQLQSVETTMQQQMTLFERLQKRNIEAIAELRVRCRQNDSELLKARQQILILKNESKQRELPISNAKQQQAAQQKSFDGSPRRSKQMKATLVNIKVKKEEDIRNKTKELKRDSMIWKAIESIKTKHDDYLSTATRVETNMKSRLGAIEKRLRPKEQQLDKIQQSAVTGAAELISTDMHNQIKTLAGDISSISHRLLASESSRELLTQQLVSQRDQFALQFQKLQRNVTTMMKSSEESRRKLEIERGSNEQWQRHFEGKSQDQRISTLQDTIEQLKSAVYTGRQEWTGALETTEKKLEAKYSATIADLKRETSRQTEYAATLHQRLEGAVDDIAGVVADETSNTGGELQTLGRETQKAVVTLRDLLDDVDNRIEERHDALEQVVRAEIRQRIEDKNAFHNLIEDRKSKDKRQDKEALIMVENSLKQMDSVKRDMENVVKRLDRATESFNQAQNVEASKRENMGEQLEKRISITYTAVDDLRQEFDDTLDKIRATHQQKHDVLRKNISKQLGENRKNAEHIMAANKASTSEDIKQKIYSIEKLLGNRIDVALHEMNDVSNALDRSVVTANEERDKLRSNLMRHVANTGDTMSAMQRASTIRIVEAAEQTLADRIQRETIERTSGDEAIASSLKNMTTATRVERGRELTALENNILSAVNDIEVKMRSLADMQASRAESVELRNAASVDEVRRVVDDTRAELRSAVESVERDIDTRHNGLSRALIARFDEQMTALRIQLAAQLKAESAKRLSTVDDAEKGMNAKLDAMEDLLRAERMSALQQLQSTLKLSIGEEVTCRIRGDEKVQADLEKVFEGRYDELRKQTVELFNLPSVVDGIAAVERRERVEDNIKTREEARTLIEAARGVFNARLDEFNKMNMSLKGDLHKEAIARLKADKGVSTDLMALIDGIADGTKMDKTLIEAHLSAINKRNSEISERIAAVGSQVNEVEVNMRKIPDHTKLVAEAVKKEEQLKSKITTNSKRENEKVKELENEQDLRLQKIRDESDARLKELNKKWKSGLHASRLLAKQRKDRVHNEIYEQEMITATEKSLINDNSIRNSEQNNNLRNLKKKNENIKKIETRQDEANKFKKRAEKSIRAVARIQKAIKKQRSLMEETKGNSEEMVKSVKKMEKLEKDLQKQRQKTKEASRQAEEATDKVRKDKESILKMEKEIPWHHGMQRLTICPDGPLNKQCDTPIQVHTEEDHTCFIFAPPSTEPGSIFEAEAQAVKTIMADAKALDKSKVGNLIPCDWLDRTTYVIQPDGVAEGDTFKAFVPQYDSNGNVIPVAGMIGSDSFETPEQNSAKPTEIGALAKAVMEGNVDIVKELLDKGANPNEVDQNTGETAAFQAIYFNFSEILKLLLEAGCDLKHQNAQGNTAVHVAYMKERENIIELWEKEKPKWYTETCSIKNKEQKTPLDIKEEKKSQKEKSDEKSNEEEVTPKKGQLSKAAKKNDVDTVKLLLEEGSDPNEKDKNGSTPLHHCAWSGHVEVSKMLIEAGADIMLTNNRSVTAVHLAAENNQLTLMQYFATLDNFDDVMNIKNSNGQTPSEITDLDEFKENITI